MGEDFAARWASEDGKVLADEITARLMSGRNLKGLRLPRHGGRVDLRGLRAPVPQRLSRYETQGWFVEELGNLLQFRRVALENIDFGEAFLPSLRFHDAELRNCSFRGAHCTDWRLWGTRVSDCDFANASLKGSAVGTWDKGRRNEWIRTSFAGANFCVGVSWKALYEDCDFSGAAIRHVKFEQCDFVRCRFATHLDDVEFDGADHPERPGSREMVDVDFGDVVMKDVDFFGFDLSDVTVPSTDGVRLLRSYREVVERALIALEGDASREARMLRAEFEGRLKRRGRPNEANVFNRADYARSGGEALAVLAERVFAKADEEVRAERPPELMPDSSGRTRRRWLGRGR